MRAWRRGRADRNEQLYEGREAGTEKNRKGGERDRREYIESERELGWSEGLLYATYTWPG